MAEIDPTAAEALEKAEAGTLPTVADTPGSDPDAAKPEVPQSEEAVEKAEAGTLPTVADTPGSDPDAAKPEVPQSEEAVEKAEAGTLPTVADTPGSVPDTAKPKDSKEASEIAESGFVPTAPEKSGSVPVSATPSPNSEERSEATHRPGGSAHPQAQGHPAATQPLLQEPSERVVVSRAEVAEALEDMRQYGASLVQPVTEAVQATRAQGASVLKQGAEAAEVARQKAEALRKAGADMAQSSAEMWHQGTEVARANWQHGAEACQRGLHEASEAWRSSAPYLDKGILLVNLAMAMTIGGFIIIGIMLVCIPLKPERTHHGALDRMFWVTQGLYLIAFSVPALVATVQCGVLRNGFESWPPWMRVELWLGILKFQLGRAVFFIGAGFYIFPVMDNFGLMAKVQLWTVILSYFLGIVSLLSGFFLLIFDVVLSVRLRNFVTLRDRPCTEKSSKLSRRSCARAERN
ncbi:unnamed protein product [Durusdinium trenchii]|uniref:Uncharacterized protein n=1 Tax=Durusdinium trenchii TaxID=1381693 RepID=A0ABP0H5I6_9DINO